jgi:hypothetical protein
MVVEQVGVDPTTGAVTINSFETSSSSDGWFANHDGTLRVITMACRSAEVITATGPTVTPVPTTGAGPDASSNVPAGGATGQVLAKVSGTDRDVAWVTPSGGGGGGTHAEPLTDGNGNFIFAGGDIVVVLGVPN